MTDYRAADDETDIESDRVLIELREAERKALETVKRVSDNLPFRLEYRMDETTWQYCEACGCHHAFGNHKQVDKVDQMPQWLASETQRIRRERYMTLAESILLGACLVIMVVMTLIILGWIR